MHDYIQSSGHEESDVSWGNVQPSKGHKTVTVIAVGISDELI